MTKITHPTGWPVFFAMWWGKKIRFDVMQMFVLVWTDAFNPIRMFNHWNSYDLFTLRAKIWYCLSVIPIHTNSNPITIIIFPNSDTNKTDLRPILGHNPPVDNQLTSMHPSTAKHPFAFLHIRPTNAQWRSMAVRFPRGLFLSDLCITSSGW